MSSDATVTEDSPKFTRVEHTSSNRNIVPKFAQTGQDKKLEELTNINSIGKKKKKRKIFGSLFKKKNRRRLFGEPIDPQASTPPPVLETLISHLETKATTVGIFRQSASVTEVESIKKIYESGKEIDWSTYLDSHTVANVLLTYLLRLPEPLLCFDLYDSFIAAEEYVVDEESRLNFLRKLLDTLPGGYRIVLERVIGLLAIVSTHASVNKMSVHNLGIVFGPALMRRKIEDVKQVVQDSPVIIRIVRALIEDHAFFFKNGERSLKIGLPSPSSASETDLVRRGTIGAGDPPPFPASLRAENIPIAVRMLADELTEAQESLLKSSVAGVEGGGKPNSGGGKEDSAIIAAQQEKFKALQNMVSSAFINIKHQLTYLSIQIEDRIKTMDDVMACYQLVKCLKQIINSPPGSVSLSSLTIPAKSSRASTRMLPVIPEITEKIQTLHVKLKSSFAGIQTSFKTLETQLYEDTLFMEISESIDLAVKLGVVARDIKKLLDTFEDSISTSQPNIAPGTLPNDGIIEQTAESIERTIRRQLQLLRTELECVTSLDEAVCLTRVIRTVKKAFLNPEDTNPLREVIQKPPRNAAICIPTAAERSKIDTICEVVGYGFSEIENRFQELDLNVYIKVQFLKQISEFLNTFLSQEAPASGGPVDNTFELALEAALVNDDEVTTPTATANQTKEGTEVAIEFDPLTTGLTTSTTTTDTATTTSPSKSEATQEVIISTDEKKEEEKEVVDPLESTCQTEWEGREEEKGKEGNPRSEDNEGANKDLVLPNNSNTTLFVEEKESCKFYVVLSEEKEVSLDHLDILERAKELAVSTILQLQTNINSLQIELTNTTENTAIRSGAAIANELKKMLEGDYNFENEPDTKHRLNTRFDSDSSDAELSAITSVALTCLDESRGVLTSFNQKVGSTTTSEEVGQVQRTVERVILQLRQLQDEAICNGASFSESIKTPSSLSLSAVKSDNVLSSVEDEPQL